MSERPVLSVILPTDAFSTIEPVVRRLRTQSVAQKLKMSSSLLGRTHFDRRRHIWGEFAARVAKGVTAAHRGDGVPFAVYPAPLLGTVVSAMGELVGYLGGPVAWAERRMTEDEIHRLRYLRV